MTTENPLLSTASRDAPLDAMAWFTWQTEEAEAGWLLTYVDVLSVILAMLVVLLGHMAVQQLQPPQADSNVATTAMLIPALPEMPEIKPPQLSAKSSQEPLAPVLSEAHLISTIESRFRDEVKVLKREHGFSLEISDVILFNSGKAELIPEAGPVLSRLATILREIGDANISVEGHTDDRPIKGGRYESNWELAAARANAVTRFLLSQGLSAKRLRSVSYGDAHPVADNSNPAGRAENRRVNLLVEFL